MFLGSGLRSVSIRHFAFPLEKLRLARFIPYPWIYCEYPHPLSRTQTHAFSFSFSVLRVGTKGHVGLNAYNHIIQAAMESCFGLFRPHQHSIPKTGRGGFLQIDSSTVEVHHVLVGRRSTLHFAFLI